MNKYIESMTINILTPENAKPDLLLRGKHRKNYSVDGEVDVCIALAGLQSALAEVTKLKVALANSEHELIAARELIAIFKNSS